MEAVTIKLVIFDLDGTLVDTSLDLTHAINIARRELGLAELSPSEVIASVGNGAQRMVERTFADRPDLIPEALAIYHSSYAVCQTESVSLYPGVKETLDFLEKKKIPMYVSTNKPEHSAREVLRHLQVESYFSSISGDNGVRPLKPNPAPIHEILNTDKYDPQSCLMVGDSWVDVECARNAGIRVAFITNRMGRPHNSISPDYTISSTLQIIALFDTIS